MKRRIAICLLTTALLSIPPFVGAQPAKKLPRIGFVSSSIGDANAPEPQIEAFRQGLRYLGYIEGKDILIEYRSLKANPEVDAKIVAELVQLKVDVLVVRALPIIRLGKEATKTIPIVMVTTQDPVAAGLIDSLARPGGNITGVTTLQRELSGKRLEFLKQAVPGISRVAALGSTTQVVGIDFKPYEAPAQALKLQLQPLAVQGPKPDFEGAFQAAAKGRANALITMPADCSVVTQSELRTLPQRTDCLQCTSQVIT